MLMYADDTVLLANTSEGFQKGLSDLQKYCGLWGIKVNERKTMSVSVCVWGGGGEGVNAASGIAYRISHLSLITCRMCACSIASMFV